MHNTNRSKAFIITFISVILLLVAVYFLFFKGRGTTEGTLANKMFAPLLGTAKPKDIKPVDNVNTNTTDNNVDTGTTPIDETPLTGGNTTGGITTSPGFQLNSIPTPTGECRDIKGSIISCSTNNTNVIYQCGDGLDNDGDGTIDAKDSSCHLDFTTINAKSYDKNLNDEGVKKTEVAVVDKCPEGNPVILTDVEQKELTTLLADYYKIAGKLKTEADIQNLNDAGVEYKDLIAQATDLTNECIIQKADIAYTGPQSIKDNPYYQSTTSTGAESYLADEVVDPLRKLIEVAIKYTPVGTFGDPITVGDPSYSNLDTFFTNNADFENLFGIW